eukprot:2799342-Rhodomonas_salina.2
MYPFVPRTLKEARCKHGTVSATYKSDLNSGQLPTRVPWGTRVPGYRPSHGSSGKVRVPSLYGVYSQYTLSGMQLCIFST